MSIFEVEQALPDILAHGLRVVFCGINPGAEAATTGHHFLGRGNRFWPVLHLAGFTPYLVTPENDGSVLDFGLGLTAAVARPTSRADQVRKEEFTEAASVLLAKLEFFKPSCIAFLGKAAYVAMTGKRNVAWGEQAERFGGARVWILPNPSGLNRGFTKERLVDAYSELRRAITSTNDCAGAA
jgi:TDG/mug DNA glycosylase family protein